MSDHLRDTVHLLAVEKLKLCSVKKEGVPSRFNLIIPGRANICPDLVFLSGWGRSDLIGGKFLRDRKG